jgi:Leucine-rich repeat (LRR) protein
LEDLTLEGNKIKNLPENIGNLKTLTKLNLSNNQITNIPESIGSLTNLKELYLTNNQVKHLPLSMSNTSKLTNLKDVKLDESKLDKTDGSTERAMLHLRKRNLLKPIYSYSGGKRRTQKNKTLNKRKSRKNKRINKKITRKLKNFKKKHTRRSIRK